LMAVEVEGIEPSSCRVPFKVFHSIYPFTPNKKSPYIYFNT
jgi:hypothetical protein